MGCGVSIGRREEETELFDSKDFYVEQPEEDVEAGRYGEEEERGEEGEGTIQFFE